MEDLTTFIVKEVKLKQQRKEKETSNPLENDSGNRSKKQSHPNELFKN